MTGLSSWFTKGDPEAGRGQTRPQSHSQAEVAEVWLGP